MCEKFHQLLAVGRWFPPGTPVSSTRKLISSSFYRLDMTLAVAKALTPNKQQPTNSKGDGVSMGLHGFPWVSMGFHGSSRVSMGPHGSLWVCVRRNPPCTVILPDPFMVSGMGVLYAQSYRHGLTYIYQSL